MDSKHAAPRRASTVSAACGLLTSIIALWFSDARAECTVDQLVLRDGIVSLSVPSNPPDAGPDLISLGTVADPARNRTYSIWRVLNNSAAAIELSSRRPVASASHSWCEPTARPLCAATRLMPRLTIHSS